MSFANSFVQGLDTGAKRYFDIQRNIREQEAADRATKEFARKEAVWAKEDANDAADQADIEALTRPNAGNYKITDTSGGLGLKYKGATPAEAPETNLGTESYGLSRAPAPKLTAPKGGYTTNSAPEGADAEAIVGRMALRKKDLGEFRLSQDRARAFKADDETRKTVSELRALHDAAVAPDATDEARQAWAAAAAPYTQMISKFNGMALDARVNPVTGRLEAIPYSGGAVQPVAFEQALPYMLASKQLLSKYGDVGKAVDALHKMSNEERDAVMRGTEFRFGIGDKVSRSVGEEFRNQTDRSYKEGALRNDNARLSIARDRAAMDKMGAAEYFTDPKTGDTYAAIPTMGKRGLEYQTVKINPEGISGLKPLRGGQAKPVADHEVKPAGTIMQRGGDGTKYKIGPAGEEFDLKAPDPSKRADVLGAAGIAPSAMERVEWGADGRFVKFGNALYDSTNKEDLKQLKSDLDADAINTTVLGEIQARGGYSPRRPVAPASMVQNASELARLRVARGLQP